MKHIKIFEQFKKHELTKEQREWLDSVVLGNWVVNAQGKVDVEGSVNNFFHQRSLERLPVEFGRVSSYFNVEGCKELTTLKGCPREVGNWFSCHGCTSLVTLEGCPNVVKGWFNCSGCTSLVTLEGCPRTVEGAFDCSGCTSLVTLEGCPTEIGDDFWCRNCPQLRSLSGAPRIKRGNHQFFSNLPKVPMEELELDKNDPSLFQHWAQSGMKIEDFLRQKRGYIKGREFGF